MSDAARDKVVELVAGADRTLVHIGLSPQQPLESMAGRTGVFEVADAQGQPGDPEANFTPCDGATLYQEDWVVRVRLEAGTTAREQNTRRFTRYRQAINAALKQTDQFADALYSARMTGHSLVDHFEAGSHPVARIGEVRVRVRFFA